MSTYGFLLLPSHNRVYARSSPELARSELLVFGEAALGGRVRDVAERELAGVPYLTFAADGLDAADLDLLGNLSALYALFEIEDGAGGAGGGERLRPVRATGLDRFPSDLLTVQKYPGKTNEDFTKLLLNVTAMALDEPRRLLEGRLSVLDPLAGRGTTLNQAVMYGMHAAGLEHDGRSVEAYQNFLRHWLKNSRIKHQATAGPVRRDRRTLGRRFHVTLGESKERYRRGETLDVTMVHADTTRGADFFRPGSFDLLVTDAPYGVQHGSRSARQPGGARGGAGDAALTRSPLPLLESALPEWARLLRPGGALGLSWNTYVARREDLVALLAGAGFEVRDEGPWRGFRHRVDQAIVRDLVVARKVGSG